MKSDTTSLIRPILAALLVSLGTAALAAAAYSIPSTHPRIFFTQADLPTIAARCKEGGSHREYYLKLKEFADWGISNNSSSAKYLPDYALLYKIHKQWNDEGYQGGSFSTTPYWTYVRDALLGSGNWPADGSGAELSMACDWIWENLTPSEISTAAAKYGAPDVNIYDEQTWRGGTSFKVCTSMFRSLLFAGSNADGGSHSTEYQEICNYIESIYAKALDLTGGPGPNGAVYSTQNVDERIWALEAFTVATGIDGWSLAGKWGREYAEWLKYSLPPHRGIMEGNQDYNLAIWGDSYKNVALMAKRARDPFNQNHTDAQWNRIVGRSISDYRNSAIWSFVLFYDPSVAAQDMNSAPKAVRLGAGGMDHIYMTSGFSDGANATWACFEAGRYFYGHQHVDAGSFTINRKGDLIIDSGYYGQYRATSGGSHAKHYYHRSIAHNCVSIYDPGEDFYWGADGTSAGTISNDGGQVVPPSGPGYNEVIGDSTYNPGRMLAWETNDLFTYARANLMNAYDYESFAQTRSLPFHANKVSAITREFVYLRPDYFVVFDRVTSTNASFAKTWNLHVAADPQIFGGAGVQRMGNATAGIWDYSGASLVKITDTNPLYQGGRIFLKVLLPKSRVIRKIGGDNRSSSGYAYWVGGFDMNGRYDPTKGQNYYWGDWKSGNEYNEDFLTSRATPGWGRIEVEASSPALHDNFLNVLYPVDGSVDNIPETNLIETADMAGAEIVNDRVILFGRTATTGIDSVTYQIAGYDTAALHMICNLVPSATYHVYRQGTTLSIRKDGLGAPGGATELVTPAPLSSSSGVLAFYDDGTAVGPPPSPITISNVTAVFSGYQVFAVSITWSTDVPADSRVEYGTTSSYGATSYIDPALVTNHSITLTDPEVVNDQLYHFRVISEAPGSDPATSGDYQFTFDVEPPGRVGDLREGP